jgi:GcrA cell cycle regulator
MYGSNAIDWNDGNVATLKTMWAAGRSHSQIAAVIPNASRSAIAGKIMRLKLPPRDKGHSAPRPRQFNGSGMMTASPPSPSPRSNITRLQVTANGHDKAPPKPAAENWPHRRTAATNLAERIEVADEPLPPILRGEKPDGTGIQLRDLDKSNCHWPKGDPLLEDFEFCGAKALPGLPYCAGHSRIAYAPPTARASSNKWALHRADTKS